MTEAQHIKKAMWSGLRAWLLQRATALVILAFVLYLVLRLLVAPPGSYEAWRAWLLAPAMRGGLMLLFLALALHAWVGTRDVILDYVKPMALRFTAFAVLLIGLVGTVAAAALVLIQP